jgi:hypothetical protein
MGVKRWGSPKNVILKEIAAVGYGDDAHVEVMRQGWRRRRKADPAIGLG